MPCSEIVPSLKSSDLAILLTSAPALEELELDNLSDEILEQAIVQRGFPKLEELNIYSFPT